MFKKENKRYNKINNINIKLYIPFPFEEKLNV
jgi:hypothetical protein